MTNTTKIIAGVVVGIVAIAAIAGSYFYPQAINVTRVEQVGSVSDVGTVNSSARLASVVMEPATASATTTAVYNNGPDRFIESSFVACTGVGTSKTPLTGAGLAQLQITLATSTSLLKSTAGYNSASILTVATSSPYLYQASTTASSIGTVGLIWPASTYMNFGFNATNTANCTVGVHYLNM